MELQLNVDARYTPSRAEPIDTVLRHFESPAWVRLVLKQVVPQLKRVSPTRASTLAKLVLDAERSRRCGGGNVEEQVSCSICLAKGKDPGTVASGSTDSATMPTSLPCGHRFHSACAQSWLRRRSTCPLCRFQLPSVYTGTYAVAAVRSTLVVSENNSALEPFVAGASGQELRVAVQINMVRVHSRGVDVDARQRMPCEVSVGVERVEDSPGAKLTAGTAKRRREGVVPIAWEAPRASKRSRAV